MADPPGVQVALVTPFDAAGEIALDDHRHNVATLRERGIDGFVLGGSPFVMKGFNYYPRDYGWTSMLDWDWKAVDRELALAASLNANTVRTGIDVLFYRVFGLNSCTGGFVSP